MKQTGAGRSGLYARQTKNYDLRQEKTKLTIMNLTIASGTS